MYGSEASIRYLGGESSSEVAKYAVKSGTFCSTLVQFKLSVGLYRDSWQYWAPNVSKYLHKNVPKWVDDTEEIIYIYLVNETTTTKPKEV